MRSLHGRVGRILTRCSDWTAQTSKVAATGLAFLALGLGALQVVCDKGQEDDWFGGNLIRWMTILFIFGIVAWIIRERTLKSPLVDLSIFLNRNFAIGCLLVGLFGACIYGVTTILPLFYQTLLGYDATMAGLAVAPAVWVLCLPRLLLGSSSAKWIREN